MRYVVETFDPAKGRNVIAGTYEDGVYTRKVDVKKHFCLKTSGYGVQKDVYDDLLSMGCSEIRIMFDKDNYLTAPIERWIDHGVTRNLGNGEQVFLADYLMTRFGTGDSV